MKNVTQRRSREWLVRFIQNPKAAIDSGDPTALELLAAAKGVIMPTIPGMTRERADALLQLIENESALEESQFKGVVISDEPFTEQDIDLGRRIFLGRRRLENGGPACIGCHSVSGVGGLGGGRLGPELTFVYQRLGQNAPRKNLSAWLTAPATATMGPVFREHPLTADEVRGLVAFFEEAARSRSESDASGPLVFLFLGVLLAAAMLAGMDAYWRGRHRAVRRPLAAPRRRQAPRPAAAPAGE